MEESIPTGQRLPLWWTLRAHPGRWPTTQAHRMFEQADCKACTSAALHSLRRTAAHRKAEDPNLSLTAIQFILEHAQLTTTQLDLTPRQKEVIRRLLAEHALAIGPKSWTSCSGRPAVFGGQAPASLRELGTSGQRTPEEMIDRYGIVWRPIRDLLVDYLRERQLALGYNSQEAMSYYLANSSGPTWSDTTQYSKASTCRPRSTRRGSSGFAP
jgi:hypothetical protein